MGGNTDKREEIYGKIRKFKNILKNYGNRTKYENSPINVMPLP